MARFIIVSTDPRGRRFFYSGNGKWSDERPDAVEADKSREAVGLIRLKQLNLPDNATWQRATVERED